MEWLLWHGATVKLLTYLRQREAAGPGDTFVTPSSTASLLGPTLPATVLYLLPYTPNNCPSSSNLAPYLYHLPVPPTTFPVSLGACYSPVCLPPLKLRYPEYPGYPVLSLRRLLLPELSPLWAISYNLGCGHQKSECGVVCSIPFSAS